VPLLRAAAKLGGLWRRRAITGAAAIAVAVVAGILTLATKNNWWSYTMNTSHRGRQLLGRAQEQITHSRARLTSDQQITPGVQIGGSARVIPGLLHYAV